MRETQAPSLIWEDHIHGATKLTHHNNGWACAQGPGAATAEPMSYSYRSPHILEFTPTATGEPPQWEACSRRPREAPLVASTREKLTPLYEASPPVLFSLFHRPTPFHTWVVCFLQPHFPMSCLKFLLFSESDWWDQVIHSCHCKLTAANSGDLKLRF